MHDTMHDIKLQLVVNNRTRLTGVVLAAVSIRVWERKVRNIACPRNRTRGASLGAWETLLGESCRIFWACSGRTPLGKIQMVSIFVHGKYCCIFHFHGHQH